MENTSTTSASYVVYASLLVSLLSHLGWIISSNDALAIVAGSVALVATIVQHVKTKKITAQAVQAGVQGIK